MTKLKEKLGGSADFFSKKVYVANDHNPPDVSEPAIDNRVSDSGDEFLDMTVDELFENTKWEEIQEVTEEVGYETEKISSPGGVRG